MTRILYILTVIFLIGWLIRVLFPYLLKILIWFIGKKAGQNFGQTQNQEKTVEYKAKKKTNKNDDDEFIEYEEVD